ncbi:MAG: hypothetical protein LBR53_08380 [Deltaproteobacteria bacterium]|jgi:hypothetical protein|nr:hypothetical protein [Deltaproteobacteria bacterium]
MKTFICLSAAFILLLSGVLYAQDIEGMGEDIQDDGTTNFEVDDNGFFCGATSIFFRDGELDAVVIANKYDEFVLFDMLDDPSRSLIPTLAKDTPVKYHVKVHTFSIDYEYFTRVDVTKIEPTGDPKPGACEKPIPKFEG